MSNLKPCPFCESGNLVYNSASGGNTGRFVRCSDCDACGPLAEDDALARAAWNQALRPGGVVPLPEGEDREPILVGETVYDSVDGEECVVKSITRTADGWRIGIAGKRSGFISDSLHPTMVTHAKPDSLESIEHDIYHLVMAEYLEDPEADVKAVMERIKKLKEGE